MKNTILICFTFLLGFVAKAQTTQVLRNVDGIMYKATGVNGLQIDQYGVVTFLGGLLLTVATDAELIAAGFQIGTGELQIQISCTATSVSIPRTDGTSIWTFGVHHQKCGPGEMKPGDYGYPVWRCAGNNLWLCEAIIAGSDGIIFQNHNCN